MNHPVPTRRLDTVLDKKKKENFPLVNVAFTTVHSGKKQKKKRKQIDKPLQFAIKLMIT